MAFPEHALRIVDCDDIAVSALLLRPADARACYVCAHGAGAGMTHPFMHAVAHGLAQRGVATLRYQFPSMERGARRPDTPRTAHRTVRAAVAAAQAETGLPLVAGGKSFGGRMTSQAQADAALAGVVGLVFIGFPLHPPGKPSNERAAHLAAVDLPMLFAQGTRDELAEFARIEAVVHDLGPRATLLPIAHADHGFDVLVRSGRKPADVMAELLDGISGWIARIG